MELFLASLSVDTQFPGLGWYYNPHFADKETEAQRCRGHTTRLLVEAGLEHSVLSVVSTSKTQYLGPTFHFQTPFQPGHSRTHEIHTVLTHHRHHLPAPLSKQYTRSLVGN